MKKKYLIVLLFFSSTWAYSQNYIGAPTGVYAATYNAATTIGSGGNVLVGNGGNWFMAGNITSADKGNDNAPNATGRSETIVFSGMGAYSNAATTAGAPGNIIDGYAGVSGHAADFVLPVGAGSSAYPVTVPADATVTAAYFTGSGSTQNAAINGTATTEYSPYIDMDNIPAGNYTFSYPDGLSSSPYSSVLESNNTSASGTNGSTQYYLMASTGNFSTSAASIAVPVTSGHAATQVYFATSASALPVDMKGDLSATPEKNNTVLLSWKTVTETNNKGFDIQRSSDGRKFVDIGYVASLATGGNSTKTLSYTYTDAFPLQGINYYRLIQTDRDGHTTPSGIVSAELSSLSNIRLAFYPNPAHGSTTINGLQPGSNVTIYSTTGQTVKHFVANAASQQIDISHLAPGTYFVKILSDTSAASATLIVK